MAQNLWQNNRDSIWKINAFDKAYWNQACDMFAGAGATDNPLEDADSYLSRKVGGGRLIRDTFYLLYKRNIEKRTNVPANLQTTEKVLDMAQNMGNELGAIKLATVGNKLEAAMAARDLATRLAKKLPRDLKDDARKVETAQEKLDAATEGLDEILDVMDAELEFPGQSAVDEIEGAYEQKIEEANGLIDKLEGELETALAEMDENASSAQGALGVAVKCALEESDEQLEQVITFVKAFSNIAGGDCSDGIDLEALKWARKALQDCDTFSDFSDLLGWGQRAVRGLWRDSLKSKTDPAGIKSKSYDPQKVLQSEQLALQGGLGQAMQVDARLRLTEDKILHFHRSGGQEQEGLGDIIVLQDMSGSMSNREVQTILSLSWALVEVCKKDNRNFTAIQFAGRNNYTIWKAPRKGDPADPEGLYRSLTRQIIGGTEPYQPLSEALDIILEDGQAADICVFTDGAFASPPPEIFAKIAEAQSQSSVRIFTINSGGGHNIEAKKFSDLTLSVNDLFGSREKLIELFRGII